MSEAKSKVNILLVDDTPANLIALAAVLENPDYHLVLAHSGKEAFEYVREREFAVILLDVQMPEMDGFETARRIRATPGGKETPIIFVTAIYRDQKFVQNGYSAGGVDYLSKPIDTDIVRSKVGIFVELFLKNKTLKTQQERTARLVAVQRITTDALTHATEVEHALPDVLKEICKTLEWDMGTFWDLDTTSNVLQCRHFWSTPSCPATFVSGNMRETFSPGVGLPGRTWLGSRAMWAREGMGSSLAFPIPVGGRVFGVMEFFSREPQMEDLDLLKIMTSVGNQIGQFIARVRALQARDEFISIASHELRTPLTVLRIQAELNRRKLEKDDPTAFTSAVIEKLLRVTGKQVERMIGLVDGMLDVTRISHGKLAIQRTSFDLGELLDEVSEGFACQAEESGSKLIVNSKPGVVGKWDRLRIEQVVTNLIANAIKYGGQEKVIEVSLSSDDSSARVSVRDNGPGIAPENMERIFKRFERAVGKDNITGLGLGLYISRQIARAHDGELRVESELGKGATFVFELPYLGAEELRAL